MLSFDLSGFDTRELIEYLGHDDHQELPKSMIIPSHLQTRLVYFFSDIVNEIVKADGGDKFRDFRKFMKYEMVAFLAQLFKILVKSYRDILCEEDFVRLTYDHEKVIKP